MSLVKRNFVPVKQRSCGEPESFLILFISAFIPSPGLESATNVPLFLYGAKNEKD